MEIFFWNFLVYLVQGYIFFIDMKIAILYVFKIFAKCSTIVVKYSNLSFSKSAGSGAKIQKIYSNAISVQSTSAIQGYHHALSPENEN